MIDYRKSYLIQLYDENTLAIGPKLQIYGLWSIEAKQEHVGYLKNKYPGFMYDLIGDGNVQQKAKFQPQIISGKQEALF